MSASAIRCVFQSTRPYGARRRTCTPRNVGLARFNPRARTGRDAACLRFKRAADGTFQSTRPYGARRALVVDVPRHQSFNPRARTGRDKACSAGCICRRCFNPRARTGRDTSTPASCVLGEEFQSTRPYGARLVESDAGRQSAGFQSTRPYGARPHKHRCTAAAPRVSIHAPVRGATEGIRHVPRSFNPRARTGRDPSRLTCDHCESFNPRARTGRDPEPVDDCAICASCFNPRARTGRDARRPVGQRSARNCFNPRARTGRDVDASPCARDRESCFNPRARTGRDDYACTSGIPRRSFNPRARTGRDSRTCKRDALRVFQSTRPYGARPAASMPSDMPDDVSIHAPVRGATRP